MSKRGILNLLIAVSLVLDQNSIAIAQTSSTSSVPVATSAQGDVNLNEPNAPSESASTPAQGGGNAAQVDSTEEEAPIAGASDKNCNGNINDPKDPCVQAKLYKKAEEWETITSGVYGAAAGACGVACFCLLTPLCAASVGTAGELACQGMGMAASGVDIAATVEMSDEAKKTTKRFNDTQLVGTGFTAAMAVGNAYMLFGRAFVNYLGSSETYLTELGRVGDVKAGTSSSSFGDVGTRIKDNPSTLMSCGVMVATAAMSAQRAYYADRSNKEVKDARKNKALAMSPTDTTMASSAGVAGSSSISGDAPSVGLAENANPANAEEADIQHRAAAMAAKASQQFKGFDKNFEKLTNRPLSNLFEKMLRNPGMSGAQAMSEMISESNSSLGPKVSNLMGAHENLPPELREQLASITGGMQSSTQFASTASGGSAPKKSGGLDFGNLLSGLLPGAKKDENKNGEGNANGFGTRTPASTGSRDIHNPDVSLFNVVNARYTAITVPFLSGKNIVPENAGESVSSGLPRNPYLRK